MGLRSLLFGKSKFQGNVNLLTPEQSSFLANILQGSQGLASNAYGNLLQQYNPESYNSFYQQSFVKPAQDMLQRQIIPQIKENFLGLDESASGALNRALAQSASDVSTQIGQGILNQYNVHNQNQLGALSSLNALLGRQSIEPIIHSRPSLLSTLLGGLGSPLGGLLSLLVGRR